MSIFSISDLHLPLGINKPMDIFSKKWEGYIEKIKDNWTKVVAPEDFVLLPGDFCWATYLEQAYQDFLFLEALPGIKFLSKGNHDYWFSSITRMNSYMKECGFNTLHFVQTNAYLLENTAICGTRGWFSQDSTQKIFEREVIRLNIALGRARKLEGADKIIVMLHYPPIGQLAQILEENNVYACVYGHLHDNFERKSRIDNHILVSCDYLDFSPIKIL